MGGLALQGTRGEIYLLLWKRARKREVKQEAAGAESMSDALCDPPPHPPVKLLPWEMHTGRGVKETRL